MLKKSKKLTSKPQIGHQFKDLIVVYYVHVAWNVHFKVVVEKGKAGLPPVLCTKERSQSWQRKQTRKEACPGTQAFCEGPTRAAQREDQEEEEKNQRWPDGTFSVYDPHVNQSLRNQVRPKKELVVKLGRGKTKILQPILNLKLKNLQHNFPSRS